MCQETYLQQCYATPNQCHTQHERWTGKVNIDHCEGRQRTPLHAASPPAVCRELRAFAEATAQATADGTAWLRQVVCPDAVPTTSQDSTAQHLAALQSSRMLQSVAWYVKQSMTRMHRLDL